jgi:hypothetical protein
MESFIEYLSKKRESEPKIEKPTKRVEEIIVESVVDDDHKIEIIESKEEIIEESVKEELIKEELIKEDPIVEEIIEGYTIYRDKSETFMCDMEITGANPQNSKARIIIESKELTYMFEGTINQNGQCKIPLKKMNFLNENESGTIKLEVIAEDMVFVPWSDTFKAVSSRKVQVKNITESEDNTTKVGIKVTRIK